jgi:Gpi18-like mannosyltransferase
VDREALRWGSAAWLLLRAVTLLSALSVTLLEPGPDVAVPGYRPPVFDGLGERAVEPWLRADALWYLKIATQGYGKDDGTLAFFPAFPAAAWLVDRVAGNEAVAGLLVSNLATWAGLVLLFGFVKRLVDSRAAAVAVLGVALFPTAFFFMAPYGEAMLLLSGSGALLLALLGRGGASFAAGVVAGLSRPFGFAIALPLAAIAKSSRTRLRWVAPLGPIVGLLLWALYAWNLTGEPAALLNVQGNWSRDLTPFWTTVIEAFAAWRRFTGTETMVGQGMPVGCGAGRVPTWFIDRS